MHARMLARAAELLGCAVSEPEELGGSDRSAVVRVRTDRVDHPAVVLRWFSRRDAGTNSGGYG